MTKTLKFVKFIGDLIFILQLVSIPMIPFQIYYQGDSIGNWFDGMQFYTIILVSSGIIGIVLLYLWIQFSIKTKLDLKWFEIAAKYEARLSEIKKVKDGYFPHRKVKRGEKIEKDLKRQGDIKEQNKLSLKNPLNIEP